MAFARRNVNKYGIVGDNQFSPFTQIAQEQAQPVSPTEGLTRGLQQVGAQPQVATPLIPSPWERPPSSSPYGNVLPPTGGIIGYDPTVNKMYGAQGLTPNITLQPNADATKFNPFDSFGNEGLIDPWKNEQQGPTVPLAQGEPAAGAVPRGAPPVGSNFWEGAYGSTPGYQQIVEAYKQYLGRTPTPDEVMSHLGYGKATQPQNVQAALSSIMYSPEANAYSAKTKTNAPTSPVTPTGGVPEASNQAAANVLGGGLPSTTAATSTSPAGAVPPTEAASYDTIDALAKAQTAPSIHYVNGKPYLFEHGNYRPISPEELASTKEYVSKIGGYLGTPEEGYTGSETGAGGGAAGVAEGGGGDGGGREAALPGWDVNNWNDPNMKTPKYVAGHIFADYEPTIEGLKAAWPEILKAFPNAKFDGKDKVDFGDGYGYIDVLRNAGGAGGAWQWLPPGSQGKGKGPTTTGGVVTTTGSTTPAPSYDNLFGLNGIPGIDLSDPDNVNRIIAAILQGLLGRKTTQV